MASTLGSNRLAGEDGVSAATDQAFRGMGLPVRSRDRDRNSDALPPLCFLPANAVPVSRMVSRDLLQSQVLDQRGSRRASLDGGDDWADRAHGRGWDCRARRALNDLTHNK